MKCSLLDASTRSPGPVVVVEVAIAVVVVDVDFFAANAFEKSLPVRIVERVVVVTDDVVDVVLDDVVVVDVADSVVV